MNHILNPDSRGRPRQGHKGCTGRVIEQENFYILRGSDCCELRMNHTAHCAVGVFVIVFVRPILKLDTAQSGMNRQEVAVVEHSVRAVQNNHRVDQNAGAKKCGRDVDVAVVNVDDEGEVALIHDGHRIDNKRQFDFEVVSIGGICSGQSGRNRPVSGR